MIRKFFELNRPYQFDPTDLTALIYLMCTILGICGYNTSVLFLIGSTIGTIFCLKAHRINVVVLNVALFVLNVYNIL